MIVRDFKLDDWMDLYDILGDAETMINWRKIGLMKKIGLKLEGIS